MNPKSLLALILLSGTVSARAADPAQLIPRDPANLSLRNEAGLAIDKALRWLKSEQKPEGWWSTPDQPALTGLVLSTFMRAPGGEYRDNPPPFIGKGYDWLLSNVQPDGGIFVKDKGLANYNTSISLVALSDAHNPKYLPAIHAARDFVIGMQAKGLATESLDGGIGYGPVGTGRQHPDLSNTLMALDALYQSKISTGAELKDAKDLDWDAVRGFIERCQNLPQYNKEPWASDDPENKGGFVYFPGKSNAGEMDLPGGKKAMRSYGSMSYAGLLSYIYADVKKDDPRVKAALDWLDRHYSIEENPGMGAEGLYYYYHVMAKALVAAGVDTLETKDGRKINWRQELVRKLVNGQHSEGFWVNDAGRWMEKDPALVTSYAVLTLEILYQAM